MPAVSVKANTIYQPISADPDEANFEQRLVLELCQRLPVVVSEALTASDSPTTTNQVVVDFVPTIPLTDNYPDIWVIVSPMGNEKRLALKDTIIGHLQTGLRRAMGEVYTANGLSPDSSDLPDIDLEVLFGSGRGCTMRGFHLMVDPDDTW